MRSGDFWTVAKIFKIKVKRKHVDWKNKLFSLGDPKIQQEYYGFLSAHKDMSENRCAYNVLKRYFSPTTLRYVMVTDSNLDDPYGLRL